jgi:hypothetical protein
MYPKLHFIQQNIVSVLCGSRAINQTMSKKSSDNLFSQLVYNRKASESPTPATPTPAQANRAAKRKRLESDSSADLFNDENVTPSRSS